MRARTTLLSLFALVAGIGAPLYGQQGPPSTLRAVTASGRVLASWSARADAMMRDGTLAVGRLQADTMLPGHSHERLDQRHADLPVFGGQLIRQMDGRDVVSIFGRLFENVSVPTVEPSLGEVDARAIVERAMGAGASASTPELGVLAKADRYALVYRVKVAGPWDVCIYFVNAGTGAVEQVRSELRRQTGPAIVSRGTGVLRDAKKVSGIQASGLLQAVDRLRPAESFTIDFYGSSFRLNEFLETEELFPADVAVSISGDWTDGAVVDAHVYQGWVYDYYFARFGRRGLDDRDIALTSIVHSLAARG